MFNWVIGFIRDIKDIVIDAAFVFAFGNLIVSTVFDVAFHGILKIKLAGGSVRSEQPADVRTGGPSSIPMDELDDIFNQF